MASPSTGEFYRCWICNQPLPMDSLARHKCGAQVPPTVLADRVAACETRLTTIENELTRMRGLLAKGFVGISDLHQSVIEKIAQGGRFPEEK